MPHRYRANHAGSFLRPPELLEARRTAASPESPRALEDIYIQRVLIQQKDRGFQIWAKLRLVETAQRVWG
jgi:methionine synthase II (cobalamin-independent)